MKVCVFCSSSDRLHEEFRTTARALGNWIGTKGHALVWGGCNVGLMNILGNAVREAGGQTHAIVPQFMQEKDLVFASADRIEIVPDMHERKHRMRQSADAFVALPGGVGTWEEFTEVLALKKLQRLRAPLVLLNKRNYYAALLQQIRHSIETGFSSEDLPRYFDVATDAAEAAELLSRPQAAPGEVGTRR